MRIFKVAREGFDKCTFHAMNTMQGLVSSPLWAIGLILLTVGWFIYESFVSRNPVEGWRNGWLYTVFIYTILSLWIESLIKVQSAQLNRVQQEQMDRIEFILRHLSEQSKQIGEIIKEDGQKNAIIRHLVALQREMAKILSDKG